MREQTKRDIHSIILHAKEQNRTRESVDRALLLLIIDKVDKIEEKLKKYEQQ